MAFEPVYDTAAFDRYAKLAKGQAVVEARLLPKPETRIAKVLSTSSSVSIKGAESFTGEARYSGRVCFKVLFESTDGKVEALDYNADFSDKLESSEIGAATKTCFSAAVLDMDIIAAEEDVVKLAAVVEVTLYGCDRESVRYLTRGADNVYTHEDRVKCMSLTSCADETFTVADTADLPADCEVLSAEAEVFTYKRTAQDDAVFLEGEAVVNLIYKDGKALACRKIKMPIERQCMATGAMEGDTVTGGMTLKDIALATIGDEEKALDIELAVKCDCLTFRESEITPSTDAFSLENELLQTVQSLPVSSPKGDFCVEESIEGSVAVDETLPLADTVLGVFGPRVNMSSCTAGDGKVKLEGMLSCNVVYYSAEHGSTSTVFAQVPFSVTESAANVEEGDSVNAHAAVKDVNVKIRRGNELSLRADTVFTVCPVSEQTRAVITEIKLGEKRPVREAAITVHIARSGETLWDAAKALGITPDEVVRQNPDVTLPCSGGERLIAYRRLSR